MKLEKRMGLMQFSGNCKEVRKMVLEKDTNQTRIIAGFPGIGKSFYFEKHKNTTLDSDSSLFSWVILDGNKVRNPEFPNNYISHIKENIGKYEFIFVSTHDQIRRALRQNCIFFYLLYPARNRKDEFMQRYKDRGSPDSFISLISDNWDKWLDECESCVIGCKPVRMFFNIEITLRLIVNDEV
jgi:hypothetical protein